MAEIRTPASRLLPGDIIRRGVQGAASRTVVSISPAQGRSNLVSISCSPPSRYFTAATTTVTVDRPGAAPLPSPSRITSGRYRYRSHLITHHRRGRYDNGTPGRDHLDQRPTGWYVTGPLFAARFRSLAAACVFLDEKELQRQHAV